MNWPNPELSAGRKCEHQPIGSTCFEATGPAWDAFLEVHPLIARILKDNKGDLEKGLPTSPAAAFRLFMIAKNKPRLIFTNTPSEESIKKQTRPIIVIISKSKLYRKRAISLLKTETKLEASPGFDIAGFAKDPALPMADSISPNFEHKRGDIYVAKNSGVLSGTSLLFSTEKRATLGGIITVNGTLYGMTAHHASLDRIEHLEGLNDGAEHELSPCESDGDSLDCSDDYEFESCESTLCNSDQSGIGMQQEVKDFRKLGTVASGYSSSDLDYLIFPIVASHGHSEGKSSSRIPVSATVTDVSKIKERKVFAATGTTGTVTGVMLRNPHFIKMPSSSSFEEMWAVRLERKTLPGDCGAWIVDSTTNELYGHIIAGDTNSCLAYIIPAYKILDDIGSKLGAMASFPRVPNSQTPRSELQSTFVGLCPPDTLKAKHEWDYMGPSQPQRIVDEGAIVEGFWDWKNRRYFGSGSETHQRFKSRREEIISRIDMAPFDWRVLAIVGIVFFSDAYNVFTVNLMLPLLAHICRNDQLPTGLDSLLAYASLAGAFVGQILFTSLADNYGRRKIYGVELIVTIVATLGLSMGSWEDRGLPILSWLIAWRFIMGVGIGADYPLSAVITSEFAPRKSRLRMLASVFYLKPIAQLLAILVAGLLAEIASRSLPTSLTTNLGTRESEIWAGAVWKIAIIIGAGLAVLAGMVRLLIPESPRYTLDVVDNPEKALQATRRYFSDTSEMLGKYYVSPWEKHGIEEGTQLDESTSVECGAPESGHLPKESLTSDKSHGLLPKPLKASFDDAKQFFLEGGNWKTLVATSLCWFLLDFTFYGLGMNSPSIVSLIWDIPERPETIRNTQYRPPISTLCITLVASGGGVIMVMLAKYWPPKKIQIWGFVALILLFTSIGSVMRMWLHDGHFAGILILYLFAQLLFNLGPNVTTFILPAEIFPTRYRVTCHGISAASGTLGCIIAHLFVTTIKIDGKGWGDPDPNSTWLSPVLLILCIFITASSAVTWYWIPDTCDERGESRSLEDLGLGCQGLKNSEDNLGPLIKR